MPILSSVSRRPRAGRAHSGGAAQVALAIQMGKIKLKGATTMAYASPRGIRRAQQRDSINGGARRLRGQQAERAHREMLITKASNGTGNVFGLLRGLRAMLSSKGRN